MKRHPLSCRALRAAGYDPNSSVLELEHSNGRVEQYLGVPPKTWQAFLMSHEQENYFREHIANSYLKITVEQANRSRF
ncbi:MULTISPECIES: KTSC domain-containing protein [Kosakonia]|uniref:KTSC domain-containing protein n=1 Tax=Kosakonia quasisacchari TaxID=2529380 RepID=A0A4R0I3H2_9ENTR|nr:KTSC domain-containing protein [Kosakonia quasisacchari]TCC14809.1 KTSC domain-containing protein [Kosakonia quasisacchari]